jgi:hypothetical protein
MRRWLGAGCALVLACACASPRAALGQESAPASKPASNTSPNPDGVKPATKTASPETSAGTHPKSNATVASHHGSSKRTNSHKGKKKTTVRGQQKIDHERAQAIQEALIREHYLSGEASGTWNESSEEAMRRYQADHGWQSKTVPDARALISLGLGPSQDRLLNPESAMTTGPFPPRSVSLTPAPHSADPGANANTNPTPPTAPAPATPPPHDSSDPQ